MNGSCAARTFSKSSCTCALMRASSLHCASRSSVSLQHSASSASATGTASLCGRARRHARALVSSRRPACVHALAHAHAAGIGCLRVAPWCTFAHTRLPLCVRAIGYTQSRPCRWRCTTP
eukprot:2653303-Pleurochrysis_carterae.AAC.3